MILRSLLLFAYALFWGGLTLYTGIVVRIAHDVLSDSMEGGLITQRVTVILQWLGVVTAVLMLTNAILIRKSQRTVGAGLVLLALVLSASLVGLFIVHGQMDAVISIENIDVIDRDKFTIGHRRYNQLTTVEWIASLLYLPITIHAWRRQDAQRLPDWGRDSSSAK